MKNSIDEVEGLYFTTTVDLEPLFCGDFWSGNPEDAEKFMSPEKLEAVVQVDIVLKSGDTYRITCKQSQVEHIKKDGESCTLSTAL